MADGAVMVVGGTSGLGLEVARHYVEAGRRVIVTGHRPEHAPTVAKELGGPTEGLVFDLTEPATIASAVADVGPVDHLVLAALERDQNNVKEYDIAAALRLVTLKMVGYTEVVHALAESADRRRVGAAVRRHGAAAAPVSRGPPR